MFNNSRYVTTGVMAKVPVEQQLLMWRIIDKFLELGKEIDYLQVMELSIHVDKNGRKEQVIKHRQEMPSYQQEYIVTVENPIEEKLFIIDDGQSTMLLASEY